MKKKLTYLESFIHSICRLHYRKIIYDLFAAYLKNSREVQKQIWNKSLELKSKISTYTHEIIDTRLTLIIGSDRHICRNNNELNNLQTEEDYLIQSILIYQHVFKNIKHPLILHTLFNLSCYYQKFEHFIKKSIKVIEYILEIYDYEESNPILDIIHDPTINITSLYIYTYLKMKTI